MIGKSTAMREVYRLTRMSARSSASVLLLGETGTGKELIASALHQLSERASGPFVRVNCGALTESLLESELFGHVRGSFTDAVRDRTGRFEAAHGGTIFLDEINSTSTTLQVKLLRVLQEREFERVGDTKTIQVDVRVVAASNCDLIREVAEGRFREDLYWRLNVLPISLPPLRRREGDIELLVRHFLQVYGAAIIERSKKFIPTHKKLWPNILGQVMFASCRTTSSGQLSGPRETGWTRNCSNINRGRFQRCPGGGFPADRRTIVDSGVRLQSSDQRGRKCRGFA